MKVLIIANWSKKETHRLASLIVEKLETNNIESFIVKTRSEAETLSSLKDVSLVICLGGDGTVLSTSRLLAGTRIPLLAINTGNFGYITEVGSSEWEDTLTRLLAGELETYKRMMIRVSVIRDGEEVFSSFGLNEAVITSSGISKVVCLTLEIDRVFAGRFVSDGLIVATPTGSTAYSLAAGGPITDISVDAFVLTPICPFTLSNRPLVLDSRKQIAVNIDPGQKTRVLLTVDGQRQFPLQDGDRVEISQAETPLVMVSSGRRAYIETIREKLNWSGGSHHA